MRADAREFLAAPRPERPIRAQNCDFPYSFWFQYCLQVCRGRCLHRPLQGAVHERDWPSISEMSRNEICCCLSATACSTFVGIESYRGSNKSAPVRASKKSRASARNMARLQAHLFAYFFWQDRKSRSAKQRLRCCRVNGSSGETGQAGRCAPARGGRIRSAPSSLTAALAIVPYKVPCRIVCEAAAAVSPHSTALRQSRKKPALSRGLCRCCV